MITNPLGERPAGPSGAIGWHPNAWSDKYVDWLIVEELLGCYEEGASVQHVAEAVGVSSRRASGRCRSLVTRKVLQEVPVGEYDLFDPEYMKKGKGKWYAVKETS